MNASTVSLMIAPWNAPFTRTTPGGSSASVGSSSRPAPGVARTRSLFARANHSFLNAHTIACVAVGSSRRNARSLRTILTSPSTSDLNTASPDAFRRNAPIGQSSHRR